MAFRHVGLAAAAAVVVLVGGGCGTSASRLDEVSPTTGSTPDTSAAPQRDVSSDVDLADTIDKVRLGVVQVLATGCELESSGTGFFVAPTTVVTAAHVVAGAGTVDVLGPEGVVSAAIVSSDPDLDLALLEVRTPTLEHVFELAGDPPRTGQEVAVIGFPAGLPRSVSAGRVSNPSIALEPDGPTLVQTDVAVNPGNSGGPLIAMDGTVVGVVDLKIAEAEGLAFAVASTELIDYLASTPTGGDALPPACSDPAGEVTPTPTPRSSPDRAATTPPGYAPCPLGTEPSLTDTYRVTGVEEFVNQRAEPSLDAELAGRFSASRRGIVALGSCALDPDGIVWWQVIGQSGTVWVASQFLIAEHSADQLSRDFLSAAASGIELPWVGSEQAAGPPDQNGVVPTAPLDLGPVLSEAARLEVLGPDVTIVPNPDMMSDGGARAFPLEGPSCEFPGDVTLLCHFTLAGNSMSASATVAWQVGGIVGLEVQGVP